MAGLENWDQLTPRQRAVFFCCDGLKSNAKLASQKTQAIGICGQDIFDRYYLDNGNEARIKAAYDKRDPRLKQTIVTPYEPVDCFTAGLNGNENMIGKQLRWPLYLQGTSGGDFWLDKRTSAYYCYRKYVRFLKGELIDRQRCYTDFPLIRYTDVILQWAEALIELNEFTPAKNLIDQVRDPDGEDSWISGLQFRQTVAGLTPREKRIMELRYLKGETQMEVAQEIGISQAQVSRLEKGALNQFRAGH